MLDENDDRCEKVRAMPVLATALLEQSGVCSLIDATVPRDPQTIVSTGKAVKLLIGSMYLGMGRRALYHIDRDYETAPLDKMVGEGVVLGNINSRMFSRALDSLAEVDLAELTFQIYKLLCERFGIVAFIYHMDSTNFGVTAVMVERDHPNAAIPEWNGHAKDGDNSRRVYNLQSVTDQNGILCYEMAHDGSVSDVVMDDRTVDFLSEHVDASASTLVGDSKMASMDLIRKMMRLGFGFVSKCDDGFKEKAREQIVYTVLNSEMDRSEYADGWEVYDCDMEVDGTKLRFVAFRTPENRENSMEYHRTQGEKRLEKAFNPLMKKLFRTEEEAMGAFDERVEGLTDVAYKIHGEIKKVLVTEKRGKPGRPPKGWTPERHIEYSLEVTWEFSEELADEMFSERRVRVLVTNLPRSSESAYRNRTNPRLGADADDILRIYLGQFRIEHAFRTSKTHFDIDAVYFQKPSRANAFMFVVSIATMVSGIISAVMRRSGTLKTGTGMMDDLATLDVIYDRERDMERLQGGELAASEFRQYLEILGIDKNRLLSC